MHWAGCLFIRQVEEHVAGHAGEAVFIFPIPVRTGGGIVDGSGPAVCDGLAAIGLTGEREIRDVLGDGGGQLARGEADGGEVIGRADAEAPGGCGHELHGSADGIGHVHHGQGGTFV